MSNWERVDLGEHIRVKHGFAFEGEHFSDNGHYIILTPGNFIEAGGFKPKSGVEKYYTAIPSPEFVLKRDDLVIAMTEQAQGLLGSSALIPADDTYLHNQRIGLVQQVSRDTDRHFLYYLFNTKGVRDQIQATATGSKVRHTAPSRVEAVSVALPPLHAQRKIAAILSAYDGLIEANTRRIEVLEEMAQRIYREWFVDFRYPGHGTIPLVDSELGPIPWGWIVKSLGECVRQSTTTISPGSFPAELFEHFSIPSFDEGRRARLEPGSTIKSNKFVVDGRCVLYSKLNPRIPRVWMAAPGPNIRAVSSTELLVLTPREGWSLAYVYCLLCNDAFADRVVGMAGGTSTSHQRVRPNDLLGIRIADAGDEVRPLFDHFVEDTLILMDRLRRSTWALQETRDLLLPRLISGEIDVADLDIAMAEDAA